MLSDKLTSEIWYEMSSSSGPGGQNVNRNRTRATACIIPLESKVLNNAQKLLIQRKLSHKISNDGVLRVSCEIHRSQMANKKQAYLHLIEVISGALITPKKRRATLPKYSSVERRIKEKKIRSEQKKFRQNRDYL